MKGGEIMGIGRCFTFEGRVNRLKYFLVSLVLGVIAWILSFIIMMAEVPALWAIYAIYAIIATIIEICIAVQRLHDIERSGLHYLLLLIPFYNIYLSLVMLFKKGTEGANEYGEDPLALSENV